MEIEKKKTVIHRLSLQIIGLTYQNHKNKNPDFLNKVDTLTGEINKLCDGAVQESRKLQQQMKALKCQVETLRKAVKRQGDSTGHSPAQKKLSLTQENDAITSPVKNLNDSQESLSDSIVMDKNDENSQNESETSGLGADDSITDIVQSDDDIKNILENPF